MFGILDLLFVRFWEVFTSAITYLTNSVDLFIIYLKREVPFFTFCFNVFDSMPQAFKDIIFISISFAFIGFLFTALRRGK